MTSCSVTPAQAIEFGAAKTFLAIDNADNKTILGFYSLAPGAMAYADTPETVRRGLARHDVPGFRLARIATDLRWQGQGLGGRLALPLPRGAACALRLKSGALCSSSMQRTTARPSGTPITALCL